MLAGVGPGEVKRGDHAGADEKVVGGGAQNAKVQKSGLIVDSQACFGENLFEVST